MDLKCKLQSLCVTAIYFSDPDGHYFKFIGILNGKSKPENGVIFYKGWKELKRKKNKNAIQKPILAIVTPPPRTKIFSDFLLKFKPNHIIMRLSQT